MQILKILLSYLFAAADRRPSDSALDNIPDFSMNVSVTPVFSRRVNNPACSSLDSSLSCCTLQFTDKHSDCVCVKAEGCSKLGSEYKSYLASSRGADVPELLGTKDAPLDWAISVPCSSFHHGFRISYEIFHIVLLVRPASCTERACWTFRLTIVPKLDLLVFLDAVFLGWIRCVPLLAREGILSFCVALAAFADTGVLTICRLRIVWCLMTENIWALPCPMRREDDIMSH